jgi:ABC-type transport system involved in multi-copper enzyme maturation permease subunit
MTQTGEMTTACSLAMDTFYRMVEGEAGKVTLLTTLVPFLAGLLLGVPIVGREVERGTTRLAWALTASRQRWFLHRLLPILLLVAVASLILGVATDRLYAASNPGIDPANNFGQLGFRGAALAARAVFVFALAVSIGALMGRVLPAVIVAGLLAVVGLIGGSQVHQMILQTEAVEVGEGKPGDLFLDQRFRLPDGQLIGWNELEQYDPMPTHAEFTGEWPTLPSVTLGIPAERYGFVQLREVGALAGGSLVALLLTALIVQRRRPG